MYTIFLSPNIEKIKEAINYQVTSITILFRFSFSEHISLILLVYMYNKGNGRKNSQSICNMI